VLRFWKLDPDKDITMLQAGNTPTRMAALIAGQVDAALVTPGYLDKVLGSGRDFLRLRLVTLESLWKRNTLRN